MPAHDRTRSRGNRPGIHHLRCRATLRALVRGAELTDDDHVYDLGAGPGTLTAALARTGARVTAVERDPRFLRDLRRRFDRYPRVAVLAADLRQTPVPRRARVVANPPFATSTALLELLLRPAGRPRAGLDLLVEHGFAVRVTDPLPGSPKVAWWAARYELRIVRRVPRTAFAPAPRVDAALLRIRPREPLDPRAERTLRHLLDATHRAPTRRATTIARQVAGRRTGPALLRAAGAEPRAVAGEIEPHTWAQLARGASRL